MLDFIPYIPSSTKGVDNAIWQTALQAWIFNLSELLDMQDTAFLKETMSNTSLSQWVDQVLNAHMDDSPSVDAKLLKSIFLMYVRLSTLSTTHHPLLSVDKLCTVAVVYGDANRDQVRSMMQAFFERDERLEQQFTSLVETLVEGVRSLDLSGSLEQMYVLVRLLDAVLAVTDTIPVSFDTVLIDCYDSVLTPALQDVEQNNPDATPLVYPIKASLVSCFNTYADTHFFRPLGVATLEANVGRDYHHRLFDVTGDVSDAAIEAMSEKLLGYIERSGLETTRSAFLDAPLIMDWEVSYKISEKLKWINTTLFNNDDARLEFLQLSMEQVRDSDEGAGTWEDELQTTAVDADVEIVSKISQVHELFPDYGDGFIEACLEANENNVEQVIMQLLENNLPPSLSEMDRSMPRSHHVAPPPQQESESVLQSRRNIYDNDEFDIFNRGSVDRSKVYTGKKNKADADALLDDKSFIQNEKTSVLQRVVDMYDDDYDDTYDDINDAGVPVAGDGDATLDIVKKKQQDIDPGTQNESLLVHTFVDNPDLFGRKGVIRKSPKRAELRKRTGMSDEQLEGWAIMFNRNPRKQRILDKYMLFDGKQTEVSKETSQKQSEQKENKKPPVSEARDRAYKDKHKARFANHNRKSGRDKKVAKASPAPNN